MRVALIDDSIPVRDLLRIAIGDKLGHEIVGEAGGASEAIDVVSRVNPDLVMLDLRLPGRSGFAVIAECARRMKKCPMFLIFSGYCNAGTTFFANRLKVNGYIHKGSCFMNAILDSVRAVASGSPYFCERYKDEESARVADPISFDKVLTDQELTIAVMVGKIYADREIAESLDILVETVERHRRNIILKLELKTRVDLQRYALEHGLEFGEQDLEPWR